MQSRQGQGVPGASLSGVHLRLPGYGAEGPTLEMFTYSHQLARAATAASQPGLRTLHSRFHLSLTHVPK